MSRVQVGRELSEEEKNIILRNNVERIANETARSRVEEAIAEARIAREAALAAAMRTAETAVRKAVAEDARLATEAEVAALEAMLNVWERKVYEAAAAEDWAVVREALNDKSMMYIDDIYYIDELEKELDNRDIRLNSLTGGSKRKKKSKKIKSSYKKKRKTLKKIKKTNKKSKQKKIVVKKLKN